MAKQKRFRKAKIALSLTVAILAGTIGLSLGVSAANTEVNKTATVVEKYPDTGIAKVIEWNNNWYTLEFGGWIEMLESKDKGSTWNSYISDYDTMKFLFKNLTIELYTYDEFVELIKGYKKAVPITTDERWNETMAWYDDLAKQLKEKNTMETYYPIMKGLTFSYKIGPNNDGINGTSREQTIIPSSYYLQQLYGRTESMIEYDLEKGHITQNEADQIWKDFLKQYNLAG